MTARLMVMVVALLIVVHPAVAQEDVRLRGWAHADYGRLVFDWQKPVRYDAKIEGGSLAVRFSRPMATEFARALELLGSYVSGAELSPDKQTALFRLNGDFALKTFANENSVVVDLVRKKVSAEAVAPAPAQAPAPAAPSAAEASATGEAPILNVRTGEHPDYDRLVFDWTRPTDYSVAREGKRISIRFDRPARVEVAELRARLGEGFRDPATQVEGRGLVFSVDVAEDARIRHFRAGTKVVFDVFKAKAQGPGQAQSEPAPKSRPEPEVAATAVPPPPQPPKVAEPGKGGPIKLVPKGQEAAKTRDRLAAAPDRKPPDKKPETAAEPSASPPGKPAEKPPAEDKASDPKPAADQAEANKQPDQPAPDPVILAFEWSAPVPAAVFRRHKYVWIVFGQRTPLDTAPLLQQSRTLIERIDQVPAGQATILRVQTKDDRINVSSVELDKTNWQIQFAVSPMQPKSAIPLGVSGKDDIGRELRMTLGADSQVVTFGDPDVGDAIQTVLLMTPGLGVDGGRAYPEFQILPSAQGVAIESQNDQVLLKKEQNAVVVSGPEGLFISNIASVPSKLKGAALDLGSVGPQILKPTEWQRDGIDKLVETRQALMAGVITQAPKRRAAGRSELAQYNFSLGFAEEALGVLDVVEFTDLESAAEPGFLALKGASLALAEQGDDALKALNDSRLDEYQDVALWRGLAHDLQGDPAAAGEQFDRGDPSLQTYPYPLKAHLVIRRMAVAIDQDNLAAARQWRDRLAEEHDKFRRPYRARLNYQLGRLFRKELDLDNAVAAFQQAKEGKDTWASVRAEYDLVDLGLQQETLSVPDAIKRLERLRFAWRGDAFERKVLRRLGNLYLSTGDYRNGLGALKVIVTYFPDEPDAKEAAQEMGDIFRRLYLDGEADNMSPLKALALYDEFRELTPAGPDGNLMVQFLAERLVNVDLLDKASDVLAHQVKFRLKGEEKAAVGTKLALIRLIARDPQGAIAALRDSFYPNVSLEIENDRRRIRAKAEFELGKAEDAIALLAGDISREADMLRSAIYFRERNWGEAGKVYQRLVGDPPANGSTFGEDTSRTVLLWAVALKLNNDEAGLRQLFELYGPAMKATPLAATFNYIAKPSEGSSFDLGSIQKQIADVDQFQAFLANYRERLLKTGPGKKKNGAAPGKTPGTAAGAAAPARPGAPSG